MAKTEEIQVVCAGKKPGETVILPGAVTRPSDGRTSDTGVILLHGAGGDLYGGHMNTTAESFADDLRTSVFRVTMKSPDANYRLRAAHGLMRVALKEGVLRFILAGQSNGARVCCNLLSQLVHPEKQKTNDAFPKASPPAELVERFTKASDGHAPGSARVSGLVLFSYPLHAPVKASRENLREEELERAFDAAPKAFPVVFVRGENDAFAKDDLFDQCVRRALVRHAERFPDDENALSPASMRKRSDVLYVMPGGDHGLRVAKSAAVSTEQARRKALAFVCEKMRELLRETKGPRGKGKRAREEKEGDAGGVNARTGARAFVEEELSIEEDSL